MNGYPVVSPAGNDKPRVTAGVLNSVRSGKLNCLFEVTLTAGAASTVVTGAANPGAENIAPDSALLLMPLTANAATELAAGTLYVSAQDNGTATLTHANAGTTDRTYRVAILG